MTAGQKRAMWQLRHITSEHPGVLDIETVTAPTEESSVLTVVISLRVDHLPPASGGLRLRAREEFILLIPAGFPFAKPEVILGHRRFAGRPHVQWSRYLCLYQSSTEWNASDGLFGLIQRLCDWLQKAAVNQLDPDGQPLHPPAVYANYSKGKLVVPRVDTPSFAGSFWVGVAELRDKPHCVEIVAWHSAENYPAQGRLALAVLFGKEWPWEYPTKGADVFAEFEKQGIPFELLLRMLAIVARDTGSDLPVYTVVGSPMRGIAGGERKQHLAVWSFASEYAKFFTAILPEASDTAQLTEARKEFKQLLDTHLKDAKLAWCPLMEARPEVTVRRDAESVLSRLRGRSVAVWGCGALGGPVVLALARSGVSRLVLVDNGRVNPGLLVRQPYADGDVGDFKVSALEAQLKAIRPDIVVEKFIRDVGDHLDGDNWTSGCDLVIDATASEIVRKRLEQAWNRSLNARVPLASLVVDATSAKLLVSIAGAKASGGSWDIFRKTKIELLRSGQKEFADAFHPEAASTNLFQPEPGCSEPTFRGSAAEAGAMAAVGLNLIAQWFAQLKPSGQHAALFALPVAGQRFLAPAEFEFPPDKVLPIGQLELRVSPAVLKEVRGWVAQNRRKRAAYVETGGLLWGEWDDATGVVWISAVSGPPVDSQHSSELFVCGKAGTVAEHKARLKQTRGAVQYLGMWHTHPVSQPLPSEVDYEGIQQIFALGPVPPSKNLLFIFGRMGSAEALGAFPFMRRLEEEQTPMVGRVELFPPGEGVL